MVRFVQHRDITVLDEDPGDDIFMLTVTSWLDF
jgi:hypothetical protein